MATMNRPVETALLLSILILAFGLALGLTYAPCYASLCSESYLPYITRLHIANFYALLASTGFVLFICSSFPTARRLSNTYIVRHEVPVLRRRISVGGVAVAIWIIGLTIATTAFWVGPLLEYWDRRTGPLQWTSAQIRLTVTAVIGHHADILLGLVIIPVSRNSLLGRVFHLHHNTLLFAHKVIAYTLFVAALAHGAAYYTFVGAYRPAAPESKAAFNIDNPTQTMAEAESGSGWYYATLPTGMIGFLLILLIIITSLRVLRRKSYNTFYYLHLICSFWTFVVLSVHASTDFYFLIPGLGLLVFDWAWRLFKGDAGGLSKTLIVSVENAGDDWYRITMPAMVNQMRHKDDAEKQAPVLHPIQSYNLVFPEISKIQSHAFTAAKIGSVAEGPSFLLQKAQGKSAKQLQKEWTWKLGALVSTLGSRQDLECRAEGPYIPSDSGFTNASRVVCIVGGTGITGACSVADWWAQHRSQEAESKFTLIWTVRHRITSRIDEWQKLVSLVSGVSNMDCQLQVTSESGRIDTALWLRDALEADQLDRPRPATNNAPNSTAWVYISGPDSLLKDTEAVCVNLRRHIRGHHKADNRALASINDLEWYSAKWEV